MANSRKQSACKDTIEMRRALVDVVTRQILIRLTQMEAKFAREIREVSDSVELLAAQQARELNPELVASQDVEGFELGASDSSEKG